MWYLSPQIKKKLVWEWGRTSLQVRLCVKGKSMEKPRLPSTDAEESSEGQSRPRSTTAPWHFAQSPYWVHRQIWKQIKKTFRPCVLCLFLTMDTHCVYLFIFQHVTSAICITPVSIKKNPDFHSTLIVFEWICAVQLWPCLSAPLVCVTEREQNRWESDWRDEMLLIT